MIPLGPWEALSISIFKGLYRDHSLAWGCWSSHYLLSCFKLCLSPDPLPHLTLTAHGMHASGNSKKRREKKKPAIDGIVGLFSYHHPIIVYLPPDLLLVLVSTTLHIMGRPYRIFLRGWSTGRQSGSATTRSFYTEQNLLRRLTGCYYY